MARFLLSIKTSVWLLCALLGLLFAGAFIMPVEEAFQSIHSLPLFDWLMEQDPRATWWLWGCIGLLCLLTLNTFVCSVESIIKKRTSEKWLMIISPQVVHIGFLFMLLAHLLSSMGGLKSMGVAEEGGILTLPGGTFQIARINISTDPNGYIVDWSVEADYRSESGQRREVLLPNKPFFQDGLGIYVRDLRAAPAKEILIEVSREPGALWALIGGILFLAGILTLIALRIRRDYPVVPR